MDNINNGGLSGKRKKFSKLKQHIMDVASEALKKGKDIKTNVLSTCSIGEQVAENPKQIFVRGRSQASTSGAVPSKLTPNMFCKDVINTNWPEIPSKSDTINNAKMSREAEMEPNKARESQTPSPAIYPEKGPSDPGSVDQVYQHSETQKCRKKRRFHHTTDEESSFACYSLQSKKPRASLNATISMEGIQKPAGVNRIHVDDYLSVSGGSTTESAQETVFEESRGRSSPENSPVRKAKCAILKSQAMVPFQRRFASIVIGQRRKTTTGPNVSGRGSGFADGGTRIPDSTKVMVSSSQGGQMVLSSQGGTIVSSQGGQGQMVLSSQGGTIVSSRVGGGAVMINSQDQQVGQLVNTSGGQLVSQGHQLVNTGAGQLVSGGQLVQSSGGQLFLKAGQAVVSQPPAAGQAMLLTQGSGQQKTIIIMQAQNKQGVATTGANQLVQVSPGGRDQLVQLGGQLVQVAGQPTQQLVQVQGQQTQQLMQVSGQQLVQPQLVQVQGRQMVQVLPGQQQGHVVQVQPGAGQQLMQVQGQPLVPGQQIVQVGGKQGAVLQGQAGGVVVGPVIQNPVIQQVVISQASGQQSSGQVVPASSSVIQPNQTIQSHQGLANGSQPLVNGIKASPPPSVSPSPTVTSASPSPPPPIKINPSAPFVCEWASCLKAFKTPKEVENHAITEHCPLGSDDIPCLWQRCDGMKRKRFSLMTHLQDRHCHPQLMAVRRVQISQNGKSDVPLPPAPSPHPGYAPNAALHAIKKHSVEFVNPKEIAEMSSISSLKRLHHPHVAVEDCDDATTSDSVARFRNCGSKVFEAGDGGHLSQHDECIQDRDEENLAFDGSNSGSSGIKSSSSGCEGPVPHPWNSFDVCLNVIKKSKPKIDADFQSPDAGLDLDEPFKGWEAEERLFEVMNATTPEEALVNKTSCSSVSELSNVMIPLPSSFTVEEIPRNNSPEKTMQQDEILVPNRDLEDDVVIEEMDIDVAQMEDKPNEIQKEAQLDDFVQPDSGSKKLTRKKIANPTKWKRKAAQLKRNSGDEYVNRSGKLKSPRPVTACVKCQYKCGNKISTVEQNDLRVAYNNLPDHNAKKMYLSKLVKEYDSEERRKDVDANENEKKDVDANEDVEVEEEDQVKKRKKRHVYHYHVPVGNTAVRVCGKFFCGTFGLHSHTISYMFQNSMDKSTLSYNGRKNVLTKEKKAEIKSKRSLCIRHIRQLPKVESHYRRAESKREYLETQCKSIVKCYNMFKDWMLEQGFELKDIPSESFYRKIFNTEFNLSFHKPKNDTCQTCYLYDTRKSHGDLTEEEAATFEKHISEKNRARLEKRRDDEEDGHQIHYDLMNSTSLPLTKIGAVFYMPHLTVYNLTAAAVIPKSSNVNEVSNQDVISSNNSNGKSSESSEDVNDLFANDDTIGEENNNFVDSDQNGKGVCCQLLNSVGNSGYPEQENGSRERQEQENASRERHEQENGSCERQDEEIPSSERQEKEIPSGERQEKEIPSGERQEREIPSGECQEPSGVRLEKEIPSGERQEKEIPSDERQEKEIPSGERQEKEIPSGERKEKEIPSGERPHKGNKNKNITGYSATWNESTMGRDATDLSNGLYRILVAHNEKHKPEKLILWSDSPIGQNRNSIVSAMLLHVITVTPNIETITHKYGYASHNFMQKVDSLHSKMEKTSRDLEVWSYLDIINLWKKDTVLIDMTKGSHLDFASLAKNEALNFKNIPYTQVCAIKYEKKDPFSVQFKLSNFDNPWVRVSIRKNLRKRKNLSQTITSFPQPEPVNAGPVKLSKAKIEAFKYYAKYMNSENKEWIEDIINNCA